MNNYEKINILRDYSLNHELPDEVAAVINDVCDLAEAKADDDQNYIEFGGF